MKTPRSKNIADSQRLWPDPFLAPDVPPREELLRYIHSAENFGAEFIAQIQSSIEAQRAIEELRSAPPAVASSQPDPQAVELLMQIVRRATTTAGPRTDAPAQKPRESEPQPEQCAAGEIWNGSTNVECWDRGGIVHRRVFDTPEFLVLSPPESRAGDAVIRAIPVTPAALWPDSLRTAEDVLIATPGLGDYVAHAHLPIEISLAQMQARLATADSEDFHAATCAAQRISQRMPGHETPIPLHEDARHEREQLAVRASWLEATATARQMKVKESWLKRIWEAFARSRQRVESEAAEFAKWIQEVWVPVGQLQPAAMHAHGMDAAEPLFTRRLRVGERGAEVLLIECLTSPRSLLISVIDDPSAELEGAEILDENGNCLTAIANRRTTGSLPVSIRGFFLRLASGSLPRLWQETRSDRWLLALERVARSRGSIRLLAHETLAELCERHPDANLQIKLLAETIVRAWLFSGGPHSFAALERFRATWAACGLEATAISILAAWCAAQRERRDYELPTIPEFAWESLRSRVAALLLAWSEAASVVVFIRDNDDDSVLSEALLPFSIQPSLRESEVAVVAGLARGIQDANDAARGFGWIAADAHPGIRFETLAGPCEPPLKGPSAGFALLLAHCLRHAHLRVPALKVVASGVLGPAGSLIADNERICRRKRSLLEMCGVEKILLPTPDPDGWRCGESLKSGLDSLAVEMREFETRIPLVELEARIKGIRNGMRSGDMPSLSACRDLRDVLRTQLCTPDPRLSDLCVQARVALSAALCHLGEAEESHDILSELLADSALPHHQLGDALLGQASNLTDFGDYCGAVELCERVLSFAEPGAALSWADSKDLQLRAHGTKGQALTFLGMWEGMQSERNTGLAHLRSAVACARELDSPSTPVDLPRDLAYIALWHALHRPNDMAESWEEAWREAARCNSTATQAHLHRYRWLAGYRTALLGLDDAWPPLDVELPAASVEGSETNPGWLHKLARKYRGARHAARGDIAAALEDFHAAATLIEAPSLLRFIGATAALQAAESLHTNAPDKAAEFLSRAIVVFQECDKWFLGPIAGRLWLSRAQAISEDRPPESHPQLHYPY